MNIKNKEAYRLTRQLSKLTGESLTTAINEAVRERRERVGRERGIDLISFEKLGKWFPKSQNQAVKANWTGNVCTFAFETRWHNWSSYALIRDAPSKKSLCLNLPTNICILT